MINFNKITIEDKEWIVPLLKESDFSGCHQNFGNLFAWSEVNNVYVAKVNDFLVVKETISEAKDAYLYPAGKGNIKPVIEEMIQDSIDNNNKFIFLGLSLENMDELSELFPGKFAFEEVRSDFDYVYLLDKMVSLKGKKLHGKRNHINSFKKNNPVWSFEPMTQEKLAECWEMNKEWCIETGCKDDESLLNENCATKIFFKNFTDIGLDGGIIRVDDKVVAFTLGEVLNSETYVIHIEKAFKSIQGAYPMINREFAEWVQNKYSNLIYVNREEDMGLEGLRKAKLSYYPDKMEDKYRAVLA